VVDPIAKVATAANALGRPIEKLIETLASGIGGLAKPWMMRRIARAEVDVARIHLLGQRELRALEAKPLDQSQTPLVVDAEYEVNDDAEPMPLLQRARARFDYQEAKRQTNVEAVAAEAAEQLKDVEEVSEEPVSDDFAARFFAHAQDVSDEDMRRIWGRILAGEVTQPGQFSLRCLDVLRNITKQEAEAFEKAMPYLFNDETGILRPRSFDDEATYGPDHPLRFEAVHALADAGLLTSHEPLVWTLSPSDTDTDFYVSFNGYAIHVKRQFGIAFGKPTSGPLTAEGVALSLAGRELATLYRDVPSNREALEMLIDVWHSANRMERNKVHAELHRVVDDAVQEPALYPPPAPAPAPAAAPAAVPAPPAAADPASGSDDGPRKPE